MNRCSVASLAYRPPSRLEIIVAYVRARAARTRGYDDVLSTSQVLSNVAARLEDGEHERAYRRGDLDEEITRARRVADDAKARRKEGT